MRKRQNVTPSTKSIHTSVNDSSISGNETSEPEPFFEPSSNSTPSSQEATTTIDASSNSDTSDDLFLEALKENLEIYHYKETYIL